MPKINYNIGTITLTQDSNIVTGTKTYWLDRVNAGDWLYINTVDITGWYEILEVNSDSRITLRKQYEGVSLNNVDYYIQRNADRALTSELAKAQLKILDEQANLTGKFDRIDEIVAQAEITYNQAVQTSVEITENRNLTRQYMEQAINASNETLQYKNEAIASAAIATEQATIATEKAQASADSATEAENTVTTFEATKGQPDGIAPLNAEGQIDPSFIPGLFRDIESHATFSDFPLTGDSAKFYIARDTFKTYMWDSTGQIYVPTDTTLSLAGTGTAGTAARSDHNHDGIYEPFRDIEWRGEITPDFDTIALKEGTYVLLTYKDGDYLITLENIEYVPCVIKRIKADGGSNDIWYDFAFCLSKRTFESVIVTRQINTTDDKVVFIGDWTLTTSGNSLKWNGIIPIFSDSYDNLGYTTNTMYFIDEQASNKEYIAIKTINNQYPNGNGNIDIPTLNTSLVEVQNGNLIYSNANNITANGKYHISISPNATVTNYPTTDKLFFAEISSTTTSAGEIFSVFQKFISINVDTGNTSYLFRYGTNIDGIIKYSNWKTFV